MLDFISTQFGGWPIVDGKLDTKSDLTTKLLSFVRWGLKPFIDILILNSPKNSEAYTLSVFNN